MCGICGIVSSENLQQEDFSLVSKMNDSMAHRGPNDSGQFRDNNVMLAMHRLSIIDIAGGTQPLTDEDNSVILIANGEIYNYIELSSELKARGHRFRTKSDCETIVHLYEELGVECLEKLRGMFAFALWDKSKRQLFLARDRIGEKPLYLWQQDKRLIFASELRTLTKTMPNGFSLDPASVDMYMHYQYVPEPMTVVKDVNKLQAGHFLLINPAPWQVISKRYWNIESVIPINHSDPPQLILQELQEVTSLTLRSDVPVGIALSGGMDSNAIAALSKPKYSGDLHAFTVGYEGRPECDETDKARLIARELDLPFHQINLSVDDFVMSFPQLVYCGDDPVADIAAYGYFSVMKAAQKQDVPVMLTGFGGDELFWGYPWVVEAMVENTKTLSLLGDSPEARAQLARKLTFYERHYDFKTAEQVLPILYTSSFKQNIPPQNSFKPFRIDEPYDSLAARICRALFDTWLVSNCIVLGDRLSMASSVELRLPLLDYKLIELVMGLRKTNTTDYTLEPKTWLKETVRNILPERIMNYPKRGFTPPVQKWSSAAIERYGHLLTDGYLVKDKIIDPDRLRHLLAQPICSGPILHFVYKLLVLEMWSRSVLGDQISSLLRDNYKKQNQSIESRLIENNLALFSETLVKKAVHMLHQGQESQALDYFDVGVRLQPELTRQQCQQALKLLDQGTLKHICSQARTTIAATTNHKGGHLLLECARSCLNKHNTMTNEHWDNPFRTQALEDNQYSAHASTNQQVPHITPSYSDLGLFDNEPRDVSTAKQIVKSYYELRLNNIWNRSNHPVWFDHEIDYYSWPKNLFWIERGVFGRIVMKPGCRVLDLCSGDGYYSDIWYSTIAGSIDACDNNEDALRFAYQKHNNPKINYHHIDVLTTPFPKPEYDVITWFEAIEHFSEENQNFIIRKIRSALSPNGTLIGSTTLVKHLGNSANRQHDREFTNQEDVADILRKFFSKAQTWISIYPDRTTCYFQCSK